MAGNKIIWHAEKRKLSELTPHPENPRRFTDKGMKDLEKSIRNIGMAQPINITPDGIILSGHARCEILKQKGVEEVEVYVPNRDLTPEEQHEILVRMNANIAGDWDWDKLANEYNPKELDEWGLDIPDFNPAEEEESAEEEETRHLQSQFLCPPFTVLDTRQDYWKERLKYWTDYIDPAWLSRSVWDPVFVEIMLKWFGSTKTQPATIFRPDDIIQDIAEHIGLTVSTEEPADIILTAYLGGKFDPKYTDKIFDNLKDNRFAVICFFKDKTDGAYEDTGGKVAAHIKDRNIHLYNEIILWQNTRDTDILPDNRRVPRVHLECLVFYKGDIKSIQSNFSEIDESAPEE